jgi:phage shock protein C
VPAVSVLRARLRGEGWANSFERARDDRERIDGGECGSAKMRNDGAMSNIYNGKVLVRRRDNRLVAGVCAGFADYLNMDVNLVRLLVALLTLFTVGTGILAYLIAWMVIPEEGQKTSIVEDLINKNRAN